MEQLFTCKIKIVSNYISFMALMFVFWLHQDYFADNFVAKITSLMKSLYTTCPILLKPFWSPWKEEKKFRGSF